MYLLDTNALIIFLHSELAEADLRKETKDIVLSEDMLYLSAVSLMEMAIKVKIGKLGLKESFKSIEDECRKQGIEIVPIKAAHLDKTLELPWFENHKDPFDRLIMATSIVEGMTLISTDEKIRWKAYADFGVNVIW